MAVDLEHFHAGLDVSQQLSDVPTNLRRTPARSIPEARTHQLGASVTTGIFLV
jgi:hypothetical protein